MAARARRDELVALLQDYAGESGLLGQVFAGRHRLHPTDLHALLAIMRADSAGDPLTPGVLSARLGLSTGATTALVDRLERAGHVRRGRESADRRRITLQQSGDAAGIGAAFFGPLGSRMDALLADFDDAELDAVARFLVAMTDLVPEHRAAMGTGSG